MKNANYKKNIMGKYIANYYNKKTMKRSALVRLVVPTWAE